MAEITIEKFVFFSQIHFDFNRQQSLRLFREIVRTNKRYPSICTHLYGCFFKVENSINPVFATHITAHRDGDTYKYEDKIFLGRVVSFSHYPEEIIKPEDYSDPVSQYVLYSDYFINAAH